MDPELDATTDGASEALKPAPNPSNAHRDVIAGHRRKERDDEAKAEGFDIVDTANLPEEITGIPLEEEKPDVTPRETQDELPPEPDEEVSETVTVKVNHKEFEVPAEDIEAAGGVKAYQLNKAAEERLEQARNIVQQAEQLAANKQSSHHEDDPTLDTKPTGPTTENVESVIEAIQYGNKAEATQALTGLLEQAGGKSESRDPMELAGIVNAQLEFKSAMDQFNTDFDYIVKDPRLFQEAQRLDDEKVAAGDTRPYAERYKEIGGEITEWMTGLGMKVPETLTKEDTEVTGLEARRKRKEASDRPPPSAGKTVDGGDKANDTQPARQTPRQVIANIAKARGQS